MTHQRYVRVGLRFLTVTVALLVGLAFPAQASAHIIGVHGMGFTGGFMHPFTGYDHLLAMLAVGFWAARLGGMAIWMLPTAFLSSAAMACLLAIGGGGPVSVLEGSCALQRPQKRHQSPPSSVPEKYPFPPFGRSSHGRRHQE